MQRDKTRHTGVKAAYDDSEDEDFPAETGRRKHPKVWFVTRILPMKKNAGCCRTGTRLLENKGVISLRFRDLTTFAIVAKSKTSMSNVLFLVKHVNQYPMSFVFVNLSAVA